MADELPPYRACVAHRVDDADRWKAGFDDLEPARRAAGILGHHINRAVDDPHLITVFLAVADVERARVFTSSYEQDDVVQRLGILSQPETEWLLPLRASIVSHRRLPAYLLRRRVLDLDSWLAGYDAAAGQREADGIVGHSADRSLDDPSSVTVYHQAESFDALHRHLAAREDGVTPLAGADPEATFHTGGWARTYGAPVMRR